MPFGIGNPFKGKGEEEEDVFEDMLHPGETPEQEADYIAKNWVTGRGYEVTRVREGSVVGLGGEKVGKYRIETYLGVEPNTRGHW